MRQSDRKIATRAALLAAATDAFASLTYEATTVDDIAAGARLSKGAFYFHFSSKEDIFIELLRAWGEEQAAALKACVDEPPFERVRRMLVVVFDLRSMPPFLVAQFLLHAATNETVGRPLRRARRSWHALLRSGIGSAFRQHDLMSADEAATSIIAARDGLLIDTALHGRAPYDSARAIAVAWLLLEASASDQERPVLEGTAALNDGTPAPRPSEAQRMG